MTITPNHKQSNIRGSTLKNKNPLQNGHVKIATWNASGIDSSIEELLDIMNQHNILCTFVCETWLREGEYCHPALIYASIVPLHCTTRHFRYGIGIVINRFYAQHKNISRIVQPKLADQVPLTPYGPLFVSFLVMESIVVTGIYLPPSLDNEQLNITMGKVLQTNAKVLLGDWNMRLKQLTGDSISNTRGKKLLKILEEADYSVVPYQNPTKRTFVSHTGSSNNDIVFAKTNYKATLDKAVILDSVHIDSDHFPVSIEIHVPNIKQKLQAIRPSITRRFNTRALENEATKQDYSTLVGLYLADMGPKFDTILRPGPQETETNTTQLLIDSFDEEIYKAIKFAALSTLPYLPVLKRKANNGWKSDKIKWLINQRRRLYNAWRNLKDSPYLLEKDNAWKKYLEARNKLKSMVKEQKRINLVNHAEKLAELPQTDQLRIVNGIIKNKRKPLELTEDKEALERYASHFEKVFEPLTPSMGHSQTDTRDTYTYLTQQQSILTVPRSFCGITQIDLHQHASQELRHKYESDTTSCEKLFSETNLRRVVLSMANNKAPGPSNIRMELFKGCATELLPLIAKFFQAIYKSGLVPTSWTKAHIVPIYKKRGDRTNIENYRPISLTENLRKLYEQCLMPLLIAYAEPLVGTQGGFRAFRNTTHHIASLQHLCCVAKLKGINLFIAFLDIKNAYDKVNRKILWRCCEQKGIRHRLLKSLQGLFDNNTSAVSINGSISRYVANHNGLLQGSILSPILYSIFIDSLGRQLQNRGPGLLIGKYKAPMNTLLYADDICLLASSKESLESLLKICEDHSQANCYHFNVGKCVILSHVPTVLKIQNQIIPQKDTFNYLGIQFTPTGIDRTYQIEKYRIKCTNTIYMMKSIGFHGYGFDIKTKLLIYKCFIRSQMEYCLSILPLLKHQIEVFERIQALALTTMFSYAKNTSIASLELLTGLLPMKYRRKLLQLKLIKTMNILPPEFIIKQSQANAASMQGLKRSPFSQLKLSKEEQNTYGEFLKPPPIPYFEVETLLKDPFAYAQELLTNTKKNFGMSIVKDLSNKTSLAHMLNEDLPAHRTLSFKYTKILVQQETLTMAAFLASAKLKWYYQRALLSLILQKFPGKIRECLKCKDKNTNARHILVCYQILNPDELEPFLLSFKDITTPTAHHIKTLEKIMFMLKDYGLDLTKNLLAKI